MVRKKWVTKNVQKRRLITKYFLVDEKSDWRKHPRQRQRMRMRVQMWEEEGRPSKTSAAATFPKYLHHLKSFASVSGLYTQNLHAHHSRRKFSSFSSYNSLWAFFDLIYFNCCKTFDPQRVFSACVNTPGKKENWAKSHDFHIRRWFFSLHPQNTVTVTYTHPLTHSPA